VATRPQPSAPVHVVANVATRHCLDQRIERRSDGPRNGNEILIETKVDVLEQTRKPIRVDTERPLQPSRGSARKQSLHEQARRNWESRSET
jgi:hypothetical protein